MRRIFRAVDALSEPEIDERRAGPFPDSAEDELWLRMREPPPRVMFGAGHSPPSVVRAGCVP